MKAGTRIIGKLEFDRPMFRREALPFLTAPASSASNIEFLNRSTQRMTIGGLFKLTMDPLSSVFRCFGCGVAARFVSKRREKESVHSAVLSLLPKYRFTEPQATETPLHPLPRPRDDPQHSIHQSIQIGIFKQRDSVGPADRSRFDVLSLGC